MLNRRLPRTLIVVALLALGRVALAGGLIPDRLNQVTIWGQFSEEQPSFVLIFSTKPLVDSRGRLQTMIKTADLLRLEASRDCVPIRVYGKRATAPGQFDYFFGPAPDGNMPWNNAEDFRWQDWERFSPDVWDRLAITAVPGRKRRAKAPYVIHHVMIKRNGQLLYDSRAKASRPHGMPINVSFEPARLHSRGVAYPVLNLVGHMARFQNDYYELQGNPVLTRAFADLGQAGFRKYVGPQSKEDRQWCSEFVAYLFRQCRLPAPAPSGRDIAYRSMKQFCQQYGVVYPARQVASWPDEKKRRLIPPGSYVSIIGASGSPHSIVFMNWTDEPGKPITRYTAVSGNNKKMVWMHWKMGLPTEDDLKKLQGTELADFDKKAFFGVPRQLFALAASSRATTAAAKSTTRRHAKTTDKTASKKSSGEVAQKRSAAKKRKPASASADPSQQAARALRIAEMLLRAGKKDAARKRFEQIVAQYPDTQWARKSKGYLDEMK